MRKLLSIAAVLVLGGLQPAMAEASCAYTLEGAKVDLLASESQFKIMDQEAIPAFVAMFEAQGYTFDGEVTNVLLAVLADGNLYAGFEINGCLSLPVPVLVRKLGGRGADGRTGA